MVNNLIDPVVKEYLFRPYARVWSWRGRMVLAVILVVLFVLAFLGWESVMSDKNPLAIWIWVPYSMIGSILAYLVLSFLDRERRVRFFHFFTIFSVLLVTAPVAAFFNTLSPFMLWTVGFVEEGFKILPVLLLAIYVPNLIRTRKDGIVYGALAGMGFNIIEIGLYISKALHDYTVIESLYQQSTRLGIWGFGAHLIWSAFLGMGIGFAAESTEKGWQKWKRAVYFYLLVSISHSLYDLAFSGLSMTAIAFIESLITGVDIGAASSIPGTAPGPMRNGMVYGQYLWTIVLIVIMIVQIRRSFAWENKLQVEELSAEEESVITEDELNKLKREHLFFKRKYTSFPKAIGAKVVFYQNLLAMQKHTAAQLGRPLDKIESIALLRQAIQSRRAQSLKERA